RLRAGGRLRAAPHGGGHRDRARHPAARRAGTRRRRLLHRPARPVRAAGRLRGTRGGDGVRGAVHAGGAAPGAGADHPDRQRPPEDRRADQRGGPPADVRRDGRGRARDGGHPVADGDGRAVGSSGAHACSAAATFGSAVLSWRGSPVAVTPWSRKQLRYAVIALPPARAPKLGRTAAHACCAASQVCWSTPDGGSLPKPGKPPPPKPPPPRPEGRTPDGRTPEGRAPEGRAVGRPDGRVMVTPCWRRQSTYAWIPALCAAAGAPAGLDLPPHPASRPAAATRPAASA